MSPEDEDLVKDGVPSVQVAVDPSTLVDGVHARCLLVPVTPEAVPEVVENDSMLREDLFSDRDSNRISDILTVLSRFFSVCSRWCMDVGPPGMLAVDSSVKSLLTTSSKAGGGVEEEGNEATNPSPFSLSAALIFDTIFLLDRECLRGDGIFLKTFFAMKLWNRSA